MSELSIAQVERYFNFLSDNQNEIFTYWVGAPQTDEVVSGCGVMFGTLPEIVSAIPDYTRHNYTLHATLNRTQLTGRKTKDIESCRVLCVDIDTAVDVQTISSLITDYRPHLVIETSPGKYHVYWKVDGRLGLDAWSKWQLALAQGLGGDKSLEHRVHTIRVPGIPRITKDGESFTPHIAYDCTQDRKRKPRPWVALMLEDLTELFPWYETKLKEAEVEKQRLRRAFMETSRAVRRGETPAAATSNAVGRNVTVYEVMKRSVGSVDYDENGSPVPAMSMDEALAQATAINLSFERPLAERELTKVVESAYARGLDLRERRIAKAGEVRRLLPAVSAEVMAGLGVAGQAAGHNGNGQNGHNGELPTNGNTDVPVDEAGVPADLLPLATDGGALPVPYNYNYTDPVLRDNRFTDAGIPARMVQRFGDRMALMGEQFLAFSDSERVWRVQDRTHRELHSFYSTVCLDILHDPAFITDLCTNDEGDVSRTKLRKAQERVRSLRLHNLCVRAVMNSEGVCRMSPADFDAAPNLLHTASGVLDLDSGKVRPARAEDYLLKRSEIQYDPKARCPGWQTFLREVFKLAEEPDAMVSFLQQLFGYSISGSISEQKIFCHYGSGANGKSKVLSALTAIGGGYATLIDPDDLTAKKNGNMKFERLGAKIEGHRIAVIDDLDVEMVWNEGFVKNVTGATARARAEYERSRVYANRAKLHLGLNVAPTPQAENYGILRRLCIIPYGRQFLPSAETSDAIDRMVSREASGILNWALEGYRAWKGSGLAYPAETLMAVEEYRSEHFVIETVLKEMYAPAREEFEFIHDIVTDINNRLRQVGSNRKSVRPDEVSAAVKALFGVRADKRWDKQRNNAYRGFPLRRLFERSNATSFL